MSNAEALDSIRDLLHALNTCHVCHGKLHLEDVEPTACENCSSHCEDHEPPECTPLDVLHADAMQALKHLENFFKGVF